MDDKTINGLIIEDDPEDAFFLTELLAQPGGPSFKFSFKSVERMEPGLRALAEGGVEVLLLDLMLPDSQGLDTLLRARAAAPDVPIVVLTGLDDEALGLEALKRGAQDYLVKGYINGWTLKRTVRYAVERYRLVRSLKNIIEGAPDGMVILDPQGRVRYLNSAAEELLGRTPRALLGQPFPYPLRPGACGEVQISEGEEARTVETRVAEVQWQDSPARLVSLRDITELRRIEEIKAEVAERRKMDRLKDDLMGAVSHALRNPLAIIKAATVNLREGWAGSLSAEQAKMVAIQNRNMMRMEKMVDNVLDLNRLEAGKARIEAARMEAAALIAEAVEEFGVVARQKNIAIVSEIPGDLPPIFADPDQFVQVLGNIIENAIHFAKSRILVRAEAREVPVDSREAADGAGGLAVAASRRVVQFSVLDDGPGIPRERMGDLFNKFVQVHQSGKSAYKGTGLGLAICKEIIERQGGRIWAESAAGQGTRFYFRLPEYDEARRGGHDHGAK